MKARVKGANVKRHIGDGNYGALVCLLMRKREHRYLHKGE